MIERSSQESVPEAADRADVRRRYEAVLSTRAALIEGGRLAPSP